MNVPSSLIREQVLNVALDARGENIRQQRLLHNPATPGADSFVEHLAALRRTATPRQRPHLRALLKLTRDLARSNAAEGRCETQIAGVVDQLAADLRRAETRSMPRLGASDAELALRLRRPLDTILSARRRNGKAYVTAIAAVRDVARSVGRETLIANATLRNTLGLARYDALVRIVEGRS